MTSETEELKAALEEALAANHRLANRLAQQTTRYQEQMRPHLRDAWLRGHNTGYWNGRESLDLIDMTPAQRGLAMGLAACPYIKDAEELAAVAGQYKVPGVGGNGWD